MRKILITILIITAFAVIWLWRGQELAPLVDRFKTIETSSQKISAISYEGSGTGGVLRVADIDLSLDETRLSGAKPNVGTTKDGQIALSFRGKVFPFGPALSQDEKLSANVPSGDTARVSIEHGALAWPNFFEVNFMTGNSPKWKRYIYRKLTWRKPEGAKLEMLWRYEQFFYRNDGWVAAFMNRPPATGLIRVEISNAPQ
ncbi:MAG TPA: hypothetical protein VLK27_08145 [Chthoniobacterales bacterium]|nr:hypothetical protein [Chthoniobacterales bacterium]